MRRPYRIMTTMIQDVTGVVLAGGKSTRMGQDKALLPFHGRPLIESVVEVVSAIFARVVLSVHQTDAFPQLTIKKIVDRYPETGPMGGIGSVLESGESRIFCVACDMPFLNRDLIEFLCEFSDCDAVVPVWRGRPEVLHALYSSALLESFQTALSEHRFKMTDALTDAHIRYVQDAEIKRFDPKGLSFQNLNTPTDYQQILG